MMRRLAAAVAALALLAGCGSGTTEPAAPSASTVSIAQANGTIDYPVGAKRIVAQGYAIDNVLALGIKPVAIVQLTQPLPAAWQRELLKDVPVIKAAGATSLPAEEIATYQPDLFVGDHRVVKGENFAAVSGVTKVLGGIAATGPDSGWNAQLLALGRILGKEAEAKRVIAADHDRVTGFAQRYPGLKGKTGFVAQYAAAASSFNVIASPQDPTNLFLAELGLTVPKAIRDEPRFVSPATRGMVSLELLPRVGANFMAIYPNGATGEDLLQLPGYSALPQVQRGTAVVADLDLTYSVYQPTSLSRAWFLQTMEPTLAKVAEQPLVE
ncbi:ABC transporter substrate-binding protein [Tsukamurella tyrosinosolvens]|uniref:ABC transporter substrate-binding protein n=1 Tax=Tsukamurella tyrosinosolvens TaxID=57704 RepID=UPI002DD41C22|nr:ABC transporter substrate-binding protein [Tsukamurella tyrosinosolvens]MEC4613931.1 ABC transporter substrate-binding protein [Tsukamurella tyrosinosolvens]